MKNADMPAMPTVTGCETSPYKDGEYTQNHVDIGLTKREMFAMSAMNGILSNNAYSYDGFKGAAKFAVDAADALLSELETKNPA